jgi:hypothetical protein
LDIDDKERRSLLKDEYLFLQSQYEDFDRRSLTIKGCISTGTIAAIAIAFNSSYRHAYIVPIMVALISAVFWYLEAYWKLFQYALADRIGIIEAYFRDDQYILVRNPAPFQIYDWWFRSYNDEPIYEYEKTNNSGWPARPASHALRLRRAALQRFVYLPYMVIIGLSALSFFVLLLSPS